MKFNFIKNYLIKNSIKNKNKINKKNLYIFPNKKGFQIGILIFFCFAVAIFYQNNFGLLLSIILFMIYFISILISYQNLNNLKVNLIDQLVPAKKMIYLNYILENKSKNEKININVFQNEKKKNIDIKNISKISFKYIFDKRGVYNAPSLDVNSVFPFGILNTFCKITLEEKIFAYPYPIKPPSQLLQKLNFSNNEGFDYEFSKIEENSSQKNLSKVSWKHYSITKKLYHKIFDFKKERNELIIDLEVLDNDFEKSLAYASFLINNLYETKIPFSIKYKNYLSEMSCSFEHKKKQLIFLANVSC